MKFKFDREWLLRQAAREEHDDIAAGSFCYQQFPSESTGGSAGGPNPAFGRLIHLSRRKRGWSIEELASQARIDPAELIRIERDIEYVPGPRTVYQLSGTLELPGARMMQLSGNTLQRDESLGQQAVRFAARSEPIEKLNREEQDALEEFVKFLSER